MYFHGQFHENDRAPSGEGAQEQTPSWPSGSHLFLIAKSVPHQRPEPAAMPEALAAQHLKKHENSGRKIEHDADVHKKQRRPRKKCLSY